MPSTQRTLITPPGLRFALAGELGRRLGAVTEQWLLPAPFANPRLLEMFRERDCVPYADQVPWAGEFAGKYLTCATQILRLTRDPRLQEHLEWFVGALISLQAEDGYLGPWPQDYRLRPGAPNSSQGPETWDAWGHYHVMLGLLLWHDLTGDRAALDCTRRIADLFCRRFLPGEERLHDTGAHEMNQAPVHALALLHQLTGEPDYLALAHRIVEEFALPPAGDYLRQGLADVPFHQTPKPRWESLHPIMGLVELHYTTGDADYRRAFENLWWSMLEGDRHNNGGFTSGEQATGDPCALGSIETCCTVAWSAMSVEMLQLTGNPLVADELELSLLNSGLGMMSPSGRWVTYDTPMEGRRYASAHAIAFQARPGTPELNCCSVNGPRMLGLVSEWALLQGAPGELFLNYYGPGTLEAALPSGQTLRLTQETAYPLEGCVELTVGLDRPETFTLSLRLPAWSAQTVVTLSGEALPAPAPGSYLRLEREWQPGEVLRLEFDFRPHFWAQGPTCAYADWETEWRVFGPVCLPDAEERLAALAACERLPESLALGGESLPATVLTSHGGRLDFGRQLPRREGADTVLLFTEIESQGEASLPLRFSAGWWVEITVNGDLVFQGPAAQYEDTTLRLYRVELPLRAGKNLIGFSVTRHPYHPNSTLSVGRGEPEEEKQGEWQLASAYRGPLLLAFDHRFNSTDAEHVPGLEARELRGEAAGGDPGKLEPWLLLECRDAEAGVLRLCDFASAGMTGNPYRTWLRVRGVRPSAFGPAPPLRTMRPPPPSEVPQDESQP